jgi:hypothetical protein
LKKSGGFVRAEAGKKPQETQVGEPQITQISADKKTSATIRVICGKTCAT